MFCILLQSRFFDVLCFGGSGGSRSLIVVDFDLSGLLFDSLFCFAVAM